MFRYAMGERAPCLNAWRRSLPSREAFAAFGARDRFDRDERLRL
jgi:hypothetical protein